MSFLRRRTVHQDAQKLAGIKLSEASFGAPVPIVYGTNRIAAHLIDYDDFTAIPQTSKQSLGKTSVVTTDYTYTAMIILALCEGTITGVNIVWGDKDRTNLTHYGFDLFLGSLAQAVWSYLSTNHPTKAINYSSTAYVAIGPANLGADGALKNFSFEVQGLFYGGTLGIAGMDAEAADFIPDFLTNALYGAGWDASHIASVNVGQDGTANSSFRRYCQALGFFFSPALTAQQPASGYLAEWLIATNSGAVFTEGVLKIFPFGDQAVTGNGKTFTPYTTPIYDLTPDHLLPPSRGADLVSCSRASLADSFNTIPVEYSARPTMTADTDYNLNVVQDPDPVDADLYGVRQGANLALHGITRVDHALKISRIAAQRSVYIRNTYTFRLPYRYILLDPMDLVTLTDPKLGLLLKVVRIRTITESEDGTLEFTAEEWPFGVATATAYTTQDNDGTTPDTSIDPGNSLAPLMFDVPPLFSKAPAGFIEFGLLTGGGADWGGAQVWVSTDGGSSYTMQGSIAQKAQMGVSSTSYAAGTGYDTTHTVGVNLTASLGTLASVTDQQAKDFANLAYLDGELLSFATATLGAANQYTLSRVARGLYGTTGASHLTAKPFGLLDGALFRVRVPLAAVGVAIKVKLVSFNIYGGGLQDIAGVTVYSFTPSTAATSFPPPTGVSAAVSGTQPSLPSPSTSNPWRIITVEQAQAARLTSDSVPGMKLKRYITVSWTDVIVDPVSLLTGYEVVTFTGSDPDDMSARLFVSAIVKPGVSSAIIPVDPYDSTVTVTCAVRALYGTTTSSWALSSSISLTSGFSPAVMTPQGTVLVDANGDWSASFNVPTVVFAASSVLWLSRTDRFPTTAEVLATPNYATPSAGIVDITGTGLVLGDKIYISAVPFAGASLTSQVQTLHVMGSYQSFSATKTTRYVISQFAFYDSPSGSATIKQITSGGYNAVRLNAAGGIDAILYIAANLLLPEGVTVTQIDAVIYNNGGVASMSLYKDTSLLGTASSANTGTFATYTATFSQISTGHTFLMFGLITILGTLGVSVNDAALADVYLTYTMPTPVSGV